MRIIKEYKWVNNCTLFDTEIDWPVVAIFWGTHWDETSWIDAVEKIIDNLWNWELILIKWKLILVPKANEEAIKAWKRYINKNLNRLFKEDVYWDWYEYYRSFELKSILKEVDFFIDLHSTSSPSVPFLYAENNCLDIAKKLWVWYIISGWWNLGDTTSWDAEVYVNKNWWVWFTFESWNHNDPNCVERSYQISINLLSIIWMISEKLYKKIYNNYQHIEVIWLYVSESWTFRYCLEWLECFCEVNKWHLIWYDWEKEIFASEDMVIVMPASEEVIKKWEEVFFIWKKMS